MNTNTLIAATHNGPIHADDVVAGVVLKEAAGVERIERTRDAAVIANADIAFDVGAEFDAARGRFDHHQRGGAGARENGVPFAAAGLVWRQFGIDFVRPVAEKFGIDAEALAAAIDAALIEGVDALDCGAAEGLRPTLKGNPERELRVQSLSALVASYNPAFGENDSPAAFDAAYETAMAWVRPVIDRIVAFEAGRLAGEAIVRDADTGEAVLVLERFAPWTDVVVGELPHVQLVCFPAPDGGWRIQVVPEALGSFKARLDLPAAWAGLRDGDFNAATGIEDGVFCHPGRFIAGAKSRESVLRLAELALAAGVS